MFKRIKSNTEENTIELNQDIQRKIYVKSLQELVKELDEKQVEIEYYKSKYKNQLLITKRLRSRIRELESKKRKG